MVITCMSFKSTGHFNALPSLLYHQLKLWHFQLSLFDAMFVITILLLTIIDVSIEIVYDIVTRLGISPRMRGDQGVGVRRGKSIGVFLVMNSSLNMFIFYI